MKKQIVSAIVLAGMIATSSAFASDARELVMGYGGADTFSNGGSFYYDSAYNFFYNPAYVNDYKNWAIFEKGNGNDGSSAGFVTSMMNFNLGLFFNRNGALNDRSGSALSGTTIGSNALDVIIGGDAGVKWGLGLTYGNSTAFNSKETNLDARVGISMNGLDPFATFKVMGTDKNGSTTTNKFTNMGVGLRYHYGEWVPYAVYNAAKGKVEASGAETKANAWALGLGRETKLAEGARLVYALYFVNTKSTSAAGVDTKTNKLPIDMAVEADALSWLTLRAGVNHTLASTTAAGAATTKPTTVRVGGTFHVAKVDVDYAFGNTAPATAPAAPTPDSENIGFDAGTFHKVALRYSW